MTTIRIACSLLLSQMGIYCAYAAEPPLSAEEVATIFRYPASRLIAEDQTERANRTALRKNRPTCLSAHTYSSSDETFATIGLAVGVRGTLLTKEMEEYAESVIKQNLPPPSASPGLRRVNIEGLGYGYSGIGLAGAGGSEQRVILTIPQHDRDVQVTISFGEEPLKVLAGAEEYREDIQSVDRLQDILQRLTIAVAKRTSQNASIPRGSPARGVSNAGATPTASPPTPIPTATPAPLLPTPTVAENPAPVVERKSPVWPWLVGIAALTVIALLVWKRRT